MATFRAEKNVGVCLHDEAGKRIGHAKFVAGGTWEAPTDAHADAMRAALPQLANHGVREDPAAVEPEPVELSEEAEKAELLKQAELLGLDLDNRHSIETIREAIDGTVADGADDE